MKTVGNLYKREIHFHLQLQGVFGSFYFGEDDSLPYQESAVANCLCPTAPNSP